MIRKSSLVRIGWQESARPRNSLATGQSSPTRPGRQAISLLAVLLAVGGTYSTAPGQAASQPTSRPVEKEYIQADYYRELLAFNRHELVDAYQAGGRRSEKWDAATVKTLDLLALFVTQCEANANSSPTLYPDTTISLQQLSEAATEAIKLGCDDPMVLYALADTLCRMKRNQEAGPWIEAAEAALNGTSYSPLQQYQIAWRNYEIAPDPASRNAIWQQIEKRCLDLSRQNYPTKAALRYAARSIMLGLETMKASPIDTLLQTLSNTPGVDPWIISTIVAEREIDRAWEARGNSWAYLTSAEQMRGFEHHLSLAQAAAQKAHKLRPDLPEGATSMILISKGMGNTRQAMQWFRRAQAAQPDYSTAYHRIYGALQPRWGGSTEQILALGKEAGETNRFDTSIPFQAIRAISAVIYDEHGGNPKAFKDPEIRKNVTRILQQYIEHVKDPSLRDYFKTCLVALHALNNEMEPARKILDETQWVDPSAFDIFRIQYIYVMENIYLSTLPNRKGLFNYRRAVSRRNYNNATRFLADLVAQNELNGRSAEIIHGLQDALEIMQRISAGEEISLIDESSRPIWEYEWNYVISPDGVHIPAGANFNLVSRFSPQNRNYALRLTFEFDAKRNSPNRYLGLYWGLNQNLIGWMVMMAQDSPQIYLEAPDSETENASKKFPYRTGMKNTIEVEYRNDIPKVTVNGTLIPMDFGNKDVLKKFKPTNFFALRSGAAVHITEFTIRKLDPKPNDGAAPPDDN